MQRLKEKIAVVTGASRGGGRGIALVLGEEGATVYVMEKTGRILETRLLGPEYGFTDIDGRHPPDWR